MCRAWGFLFAGLLAAQDVPRVQLHQVAGGFEMPTDIKTAGDGSGRMFVLEQRGRVRVIKNGEALNTPFLDITARVRCCDERGLLGIAFPPGFSSKRYFYINYTSNPQGNTVISRVRLSSNPDQADPASEQMILTIAQPFANHNGGNLLFGPDGYLYIGTGDGGSGGDPMNNGQRTDSLLGKMLRIDVESGAEQYSSPQSNPFVGRSDYRPEIWATGLRNPWKYSFDRETSDLWIADVGQNRAEEVNFAPASSRGGENYGWRTMEGLQCYPQNANCNRDGLTLPVLEYTRQLGVSVTGGYVYRGRRFPELQGLYLYGDFGSGNLWGFRQRNNQLLRATGLQISTFGEDESGEVYLADYGRGVIYLVTAGSPTVRAEGVVNAASFRSGISPGSLATVFGTGLTSFSGIIAARLTPLPTDLGGTSITLNGAAVPLIAVANVNGQEQINFQVPWELTGTAQASLVVRANGQSSQPVDVPIVAMQPEIFATSGNMTIWATGLGPVAIQPATGAAAGSSLSATRSPASVTIGGVNVPVSFSGLAPGFVGLYQINITPPANVSGDVIVSIGGATSHPFLPSR